MAEVGKVVVSIEAKMDNLEAGLKKAEASAKKSAQTIVQSQEGLGQKMERSWTEVASKVGLYTQALELVGKTTSAVVDIFAAFDDSLSTEDSIAAIDKMQASLAALPMGIGAVVGALSQLINAFTGYQDDITRFLADTAALEQGRKDTVAYFVSLRRQELKALGTAGKISLSETEDREAKIQLAYETRVKIIKKQVEVEKTALDQQEQSQKLSRRRTDELELGIERQMAADLKLAEIEKNMAMEAHRAAEKKEADAKKLLDGARAKLEAEQESLEVQREAAELHKGFHRDLQLQLEMQSAIADQEGRTADAELTRLQAKFEGRFAQAQSDEERGTITELHSLAQEKLLRKEIADEEKRLRDATGVGRPDVSTGNISTALGSFTIAMPEADRLGKQQVTIQSEMLENLKNLLREVMKSRQTGGAFLLAS